MRRVHVRLIATCVLLGFGAATARAECVGFPLAHYLEHADVVFRGVVTEVQRLDASGAVITFGVSRTWKGPVGRRMVLYQGDQNIDRYTWPAIALGTEYLVFATRLDEPQRRGLQLTARDAFGVPTCGGGTAPITKAGQYLEQLGTGRAP